MRQIADWLEKLGMSEYAHRFAENGIDISVLRHLTDQDLECITPHESFLSAAKVWGMPLSAPDQPGA
jgi:hypothetical protein